ncbi:hypothetical protein [Streptomyces sp. NPDC005773]|uniref:hypothetical protein n=1 Tax=Streptomyces sp. NPDC005773 TaxID=3364727 RepID=UPI0036774867
MGRDCHIKGQVCPFSAGTPTKKWTVDGTAYDHEDRPDGLDADLTLTGPAGAGASAQEWGVTREGYAAGGTTTIAETVEVPASCTLDESRLAVATAATAAATVTAATAAEAGIWPRPVASPDGGRESSRRCWWPPGRCSRPGGADG